jgi:hypothetical protein
VRTALRLRGLQLGPQFRAVLRRLPPKQTVARRVCVSWAGRFFSSVERDDHCAQLTRAVACPSSAAAAARSSAAAARAARASSAALTQRASSSSSAWPGIPQFRDKNRRDIGTSQSQWTAPKLGNSALTCAAACAERRASASERSDCCRMGGVTEPPCTPLPRHIHTHALNNRRTSARDRSARPAISRRLVIRHQPSTHRSHCDACHAAQALVSGSPRQTTPHIEAPCSRVLSSSQ